MNTLFKLVEMFKVTNTYDLIFLLYRKYNLVDLNRSRCLIHNPADYYN